MPVWTGNVSIGRAGRETPIPTRIPVQPPYLLLRSRRAGRETSQARGFPSERSGWTGKGNGYPVVRSTRASPAARGESPSVPWKPPTDCGLKPSRADRNRASDEQRMRDPATARAKRIRSGARWQKVRELQLTAQPLCEDCQARGVVRRATTVDHVTPLRTRPDLAYTLSNLRSLCAPCHARKSGEERRAAR